jgi:hypothetical protein
LMFVQRIEALEHEAAVVAQQLMQAKHANEEDGIIIIPLNPLALAPWALHTGILTKSRRVNADK